MSKFISVPRNIGAMYNAEYGQWNTAEQYIRYLTDEDVSLLWEYGVFDLLNRKFDAMIDDYEDDNIYYQKLFFIKMNYLSS